MFVLQRDRHKSSQRCWVCGSTNTSHWKPPTIDRPLTPTDLQVTDYRYGVTLALSHCDSCGFTFAESSDLQRLTQLYEQLADTTYVDSQGVRALQMRWLVDRVLGLSPDARTFLDIGAGAGGLVAELQRRGLLCVGVEPSHAFVQVSRRVNGVDLLQGVFPHPALMGRQFDVIFLVDVIEHVTNPVQLLSDCAAALTGNGALVVVTPDRGSLTARVMGTRWWHFRLAHVGYFNRQSMRAAAVATGLTCATEFRARWFFDVRYIAERLATYLPIGWINRLAERPGVLRRLYDCVIPVNPHDSMVVLLKPTRNR